MNGIESACVEKKILLNLVLVAVFWNSLYRVADELIAREYPQLRCSGRFGLHVHAT